jgi:hypothetical protein
MKKVVRKRGKPEYLKQDGSWTSRLGEAWIFQDVQQAISAANTHHLESVELVYLHAEQPGQYDIALPIGLNERGQSPRSSVLNTSSRYKKALGATGAFGVTQDRSRYPD